MNQALRATSLRQLDRSVGHSHPVRCAWSNRSRRKTSVVRDACNDCRSCGTNAVAVHLRFRYGPVGADLEWRRLRHTPPVGSVVHLAVHLVLMVGSVLLVRFAGAVLADVDCHMPGVL